ncbi:MAG: hypothetical protein WC091_12015 [Sulfuricellaceae bacterium]
MMALKNFAIYFALTYLVRTLRAGLHGFPGAWRRCNSLRREWNDHSASLRLAMHPENRTLQPIQRRFLGSKYRHAFVFQHVHQRDQG